MLQVIIRSSEMAVVNALHMLISSEKSNLQIEEFPLPCLREGNLEVLLQYRIYVYFFGANLKCIATGLFWDRQAMPSTLKSSWNIWAAGMLAAGIFTSKSTWNQWNLGSGSLEDDFLQYRLVGIFLSSMVGFKECTWWFIPRIVSGSKNPGDKWDKWGQCPLITRVN